MKYFHIETNFLGQRNVATGRRGAPLPNDSYSAGTYGRSAFLTHCKLRFFFASCTTVIIRSCVSLFFLFLMIIVIHVEGETPPNSATSLRRLNGAAALRVSLTAIELDEIYRIL